MIKINLDRKNNTITYEYFYVRNNLLHDAPFILENDIRVDIKLPKGFYKISANNDYAQIKT